MPSPPSNISKWTLITQSTIQFHYHQAKIAFSWIFCSVQQITTKNWTNLVDLSTHISGFQNSILLTLEIHLKHTTFTLCMSSVLAFFFLIYCTLNFRFHVDRFFSSYFISSQQIKIIIKWYCYEQAYPCTNENKWRKA